MFGILFLVTSEEFQGCTRFAMQVAQERPRERALARPRRPSQRRCGPQQDLRRCVPQTLVFQFVWQMTRDTSITPPSILVNHPNHEGTVFSVFMLRTDRTSGH
jgi:hypothetical protein